MDIIFLRKSITKHEGIRYEAYQDTLGNWTTGIGHLIRPDERYLINKTLTNEDVEVIFSTDLNIAINDARSIITESSIKEDAFEVLVEMCFQLGRTKVLKFKNMLHYLRHQYYVAASLEMLDSRWATQTLRRATDLSMRMRCGNVE